MKTTATKQLSDYLKKVTPFKAIKLPQKGWVRAIREGLGMSRRQLAARLNLSTSRIQRLEEDEVTGAVTVKNLRRTAEALDCVFVYAMIPRESIEATLNHQVKEKAAQYLSSTSHSMALEDQALSDEANKEMLETISKQLLEKSHRTLWDE
jgi:predicted DNA-binding mobile mystery protein A